MDAYQRPLVSCRFYTTIIIDYTTLWMHHKNNNKKHIEKAG